MTVLLCRCYTVNQGMRVILGLIWSIGRCICEPSLQDVLRLSITFQLPQMNYSNPGHAAAAPTSTHQTTASHIRLDQHKAENHVFVIDLINQSTKKLFKTQIWRQKN